MTVPAGVPEPRMPPSLQEIVDDFGGIAPGDRLQLLLEFAGSLPALPERYAEHPELLEPVPECQSPIFLITELEAAEPEPLVRLYFSAPPESPTTRGFAGILHEGLDGLPASQVLAVPADLSERLPLADVVSPLRLRGLAAMLARLKRQVREQVPA